MDSRRTIWIAAAAFAAVLFVAGVLYLAFRSSAQLYLNLKETDEKQTKWIGELFRRQTDLERKLAVFEQNLKYESEERQRK